MYIQSLWCETVRKSEYVCVAYVYVVTFALTWIKHPTEKKNLTGEKNYWFIVSKTMVHHGGEGIVEFTVVGLYVGDPSHHGRTSAKASNTEKVAHRFPWDPLGKQLNWMQPSLTTRGPIWWQEIDSLGYCLVKWATLHKLTVGPITENTHTTHWTQKDWAEAYMEPSPICFFFFFFCGKILYSLPSKQQSSYKTFDLQYVPACKIC